MSNDELRGHQRIEAARAESEERYRLIVEAARDYAILTTDADGVIDSWSPGAREIYGWPAGEIIGQPIHVTFTPEDRAAGVPERELATARDRGVAPDVRWHLRKDDARVFIDGTTRAIRDETGALRGFLKIGQDVTRRRETEEALRSSEERYRTLVENVQDYAIFKLDPSGVVTDWPGGAQRVKGYEPREVIGQHVSLFYTPEDVASGGPHRELAEAAATGRAEREGWRVRKGGERFWVNEIMTAIHDGEGRLTGFTKIARDLTERRLALDEVERRVAERTRELAAANAALERTGRERNALRRQLTSAEEEERRRLARELHDQLGQHLAALALGLAEARRLLDDGGPMTDRLTQLEGLANVMTRDARYLALELRPPELDDVGFESALQTYVEQWATRYGVAAEVAVTGGATQRPLPAEVGTALYRIAQEALTNVAKHAGATQVSVLVDRQEGSVQLVVEDNGRGFEPVATAKRVRKERRLGIAGMRERATLAGGTVQVESSPGGGTTVYVRVALEGPGGGGAGRGGGSARVGHAETMNEATHDA